MISYHRASKKALERWAAFLAAERVSVTHAGHPRPLSSQEKPGDSAPKHWTEAPVTEKHWLDRRLPGARQWLEDKNRDLWLRGIQEQSRKFPSLQGREDFLKDQLRYQYHALLEKHSHMASDERSQTHLQMGCLVLATEKVLLPWVKDARALEDIIKAQMGAFASPFLRFLLKYVMYLSRDPFASAVRRLRGLRLDYGTGFQAELHEAKRKAELQISSCFYQRLLASEEAEHLLSCCCCSMDRIWFENLQKHGIDFEQISWLGSDDSCCRLVITKLPAT